METRMNSMGKVRAVAAPALVVVGLAAQAASAAVVMTALETSGGVTVTATGSYDVRGLPFARTARTPNGVAPQDAALNLSAEDPFGAEYDFFGGIFGPTSFGPGPGALAPEGAGTGTALSIQGASGWIGVPSGTVTGTVDAALTFAGATFASLGMTPGTYVWSWIAGTGDDIPSFATLGDGAEPFPGTPQTLTLQIGPTAPIPLPATLPLMLGGLVAGALLLRRRGT
jgi:hypothetical protein